MDIESYILSNSYTNAEVSKVTSGIKSVTNTGSSLVFTLSNNSTITVGITGLSDENFTTILKTKLNSLDESALSRFTYLDDQLLFDGESINNIVNLSTYTTDDLIEGTNKYVTNTEITNWNNIKTEVETARGIYTNVGNRLNAINLGIFSQVINLEGLTIGDFTLTRNPVLIGNVTLS